MPYYGCIRCGHLYSVGSGEICFNCGNPGVKLITPTEVSSPSPEEVEEMFQKYVTNHEKEEVPK